MHIAFLEIQNFRKLRSVRVDLHEQTTLFVGANNSGKTSAMVCLGHFLVDRKRFTTNDFTLSNWVAINAVGSQWIAEATTSAPPADPSAFERLLPSLDLWLRVDSTEIHYVRHLLPTLEWTGGLLGVRLRYQPSDVEKLRHDFLHAFSAAKEVMSVGSATTAGHAIPIWPHSLREFLDRRITAYFEVRAYPLDPKCQQAPQDEARPQDLPKGSEPLPSNPFDGLIRIDEISAQRGLGGTTKPSAAEEQDGTLRRSPRRLSEQLRAYYESHLDPSEFPEPEDLAALSAIRHAQDQFDERLKQGFAPAIQEIEGLGYPGVTDPRLVVSTRVRAVDGLTHDAAVQYEVLAANGSNGAPPLRLPEDYNGLGFQNLIAIVFKLMSYRDAWMQVGKAAKKAAATSSEALPPLHLVLVEEPEAHLHAQVQQVFIRKAYDILRAHDDLRDKPILRTQLVVSTHSSHVTHECEFACLRYFRRLPPATDRPIPVSTVINLSEIFGSADATPRFVKRYLTAMHSDLFFADAAVFVEGSAERILLPHFIRRRFPGLFHRYITILEIGGSHAHRLRPLVEALGLTTLVVTDIDAIDAATRKSSPPERGKSLVTANATLKTWLPREEDLDLLLDLDDSKKAHQGANRFAVRVAYQCPVDVTLAPGTPAVKALPRTFEDALVFQNLEFFKTVESTGPIAKLRAVVENHTALPELAKHMHEELRDMTKAAFALDLLFSKEPADLLVPAYIQAGLSWLQEQLLHREAALQSPVPAEAPREEVLP